MLWKSNLHRIDFYRSRSPTEISFTFSRTNAWDWPRSRTWYRPIKAKESSKFIYFILYGSLQKIFETNKNFWWSFINFYSIGNWFYLRGKLFILIFNGFGGIAVIKYLKFRIIIVFCRNDVVREVLWKEIVVGVKVVNDDFVKIEIKGLIFK